MPRRSRPKKRLLLVEDEVLVREVLADELRDQGFDVTEAATGDEALRLLEERADFDIVCTDVRMPGRTDGIDLAMRALGRKPSLPVLVISGYASELGRRLNALTPPSAFLAKPFRFSQVADALRGLLTT